MSEAFRLYDAYGPFDDMPGRAEFLAEYDVDLKFSGKLNYFILGSNGSGKSFMTQTLLRYEPNLQYIATGKYIRATVFPTYNLIGVGEYRLGKNTGGCDNIKSPKNHNPETFAWIAENLPGYAIENSGMMISTLNSPIFQFEEAFPNKPVICAFMNTPYEVCIERLQKRNGLTEGKNYKNVLDKWEFMQEKRKRYRDEGRNVELIDTTNPVTALQSYLNIEEKY